MDRPLWYFAYGSNLDPGTFLGRRRMRPHESRVARLEHFELRFDLPVGRGERGVANVVRRPGDHVFGVAYAIGSRDAAHLDRSEGVHRGYYRRVTIELDPEDDEPFEAFTYTSPHGRPGRKPSRRYMGLLLVGARHHGLPEVWVERLRAFELARDERDRQLPLFGSRPDQLP